MTIQIIDTVNLDSNIIYIINKGQQLSGLGLPAHSINFLEKEIERGQEQVILQEKGTVTAVAIADTDSKQAARLEKLRKAANKLANSTSEYKAEELTISDHSGDKQNTLAYAEGISLSKYQFLKYFSDKDKKDNGFKSLKLHCNGLTDDDVRDLSAAISGVYKARNLVNEPNMFLTAPQMAEEFKEMCKENGIAIDIFDKKRIIKEKMGGLLAVNLGSVEEPRFTIMEYKPEGHTNSKPYVLVGKGVVYDTGGMSLKPTGDSMDFMKSDMGGAAAVAGTMLALAKAKVKLHVIALVPSTDNRPDGNAYVPGDVITMHNGMTVEVLNTDAEGRMILADALSWAKRYEPELVIDCATLTGAAAAAIGKQGVVAMGNADQTQLDELIDSGYQVHERVAQFPFWDDYAELLKSEIADMKNIGGKLAGAITAGKFLEKFTDYPYIHIDIAGSAYNKATDGYNPAGGTGVGVRLLFNFLKKKAS